MIGISFLLILTLLSQSNSYTNPIQEERDSPDPGVIYSNNSYFAVTTGGSDEHAFPIWRSETGTNFTQIGWVFSTPPSWTLCCDYWAPEIHDINGQFVVYYTARDKNGKLSIGAATSLNVYGPFVDKGTPLIQNTSEGVIDPTVLR